MLKDIMDLFLVYLGNWVIIAGFGSLYFLLLKTFSKTNYARLFNGLSFKPRFLYLGFLGLFLISFREVLCYPWWFVASWMPLSHVWEVLLLYLGTTHLISISLHSCLIFFLWKKFDSFVPALFVGFFSIGLIEFTFIPQHLVAWGMFLGWNWYSGFAIILLPFLLDYAKFMIINKHKMIMFFCLAIFLQYFILLWMPYSLTQFDPSLMAWRINDALLPHPPLGTWVFGALQWIIKGLFILGFAQIRLKKVS